MFVCVCVARRHSNKSSKKSEREWAFYRGVFFRRCRRQAHTTPSLAPLLPLFRTEKRAYRRRSYDVRLSRRQFDFTTHSEKSAAAAAYVSYTQLWKSVCLHSRTNVRTHIHACVCVWERERCLSVYTDHVRQGRVCVCVCVRERERNSHDSKKAHRSTLSLSLSLSLPPSFSSTSYSLTLWLTFFQVCYE